MSTWKHSAQQLVYNLLNPVIQFFLKVGITPNMVTSFGLVLNFVAAVVLIYGAEKGDRFDHSYVAYAGAIILLAGLMDMIDGRLARIGNMAKPSGALYDSVLDRYSESVMFLGICYYLISHNFFLSSLFAFIAMIGSLMVSYTRARAEGLGVSCSVGIMQRPERILLIGFTAIFCGIASLLIGGDYKISVDWLPVPIFETISIFTFPLFILAIWANITAIRRLNHARNELEKRKEMVR